MSKYDETKQNALSLSWQIQNKHMRHAWVRPMRNIVSAVKKKGKKRKRIYSFLHLLNAPSYYVMWLKKKKKII